jgi:heterodisulfide reductase subunit C
VAITELNTELAEKIQAATGQNVFLCYQCVKCTSGCPLATYFDLAPNQVMRAAQLGFDDTVLKAKTMWLCASCQTCTTRCPQGIDIARVMDFLAHEAQARGIEPAVPQATLFNKVFLRNVSVLGRAYELGLMAEMNLRTSSWTTWLGLKMPKAQDALLPHPTRPPRNVTRQWRGQCRRLLSRLLAAFHGDRVRSIDARGV